MNTRNDTHAEHATDAEEALRLSYQGWSGCIVHAPRGSAASTLAFDPSPGLELEPVAATLLLTHGHFEHVNGALAHLRRAQREPVAVIASKHLCRYLERRSAGQDDRFVPVDVGSRVEANGWEVRVFEWEHMPLLPPGTGPARERFLARNEIVAAMSLVTVVVTSDEFSGTRNTIGHAIGLHRPVVFWTPTMGRRLWARRFAPQAGVRFVDDANGILQLMGDRTWTPSRSGA